MIHLVDIDVAEETRQKTRSNNFIKREDDLKLVANLAKIFDVFLPNGASSRHFGQIQLHKIDKQMVFLLYEISCELSDENDDRSLCYTLCNIS